MRRRWDLPKQQSRSRDIPKQGTKSHSYAKHKEVGNSFKAPNFEIDENVFVSAESPTSLTTTRQTNWIRRRLSNTSTMKALLTWEFDPFDLTSAECESVVQTILVHA